jgi:hypothetical protein
MAATVVASFGLAGAVWGQVPASGVEASYCVDAENFQFDITAIVTVEDDPTWGYIEVSPVNFGTEYFRVDYELTGGALNTTTPPSVISSAAPDNLLDGAVTHEISATRLNDGTPYDTYEVSYSGSIPHGAVPLTTSDDVNYTNAYDREFGGIVVDLNVPISECDGPPVSTTTPPPTTTQPPPTTTEPPATTQPPATTTAPTTTQAPTTTEAPTTTVEVSPSSTLPETGVGDALRISAPLGLGFVLAGLAALGTATLIGRLRREE